MNGQGHIFTKNNDPKLGLTTGWDWLSAPMNEGDYFGNEQFNKRPNGSLWIESLGNPKDKVDTWFQTAQIGKILMASSGNEQYCCPVANANWLRKLVLVFPVQSSMNKCAQSSSTCLVSAGHRFSV